MTAPPTYRVALCPKCHGQKRVWTPPWVEEHLMTYMTWTTGLYACPTCRSEGVLVTPLLLPVPVAPQLWYVFTPTVDTAGHRRAELVLYLEEATRRLAQHDTEHPLPTPIAGAES